MKLPGTKRRTSLVAALIAALSIALGASAQADDMESEIDYLVAQIGQSDCTFIRNGKEHSAKNAEDHLQMKRRRGKRYYDTTEQFIERIASKSSWTGKPYLIRCGDGESVPAGAWLRERLEEFRAGTS
jgi:hypothetical protein